MGKCDLDNLGFGVVNTVVTQQLLGSRGIVYDHANQALSFPLECLEGEDIHVTFSERSAALRQCARLIF